MIPQYSQTTHGLHVFSDYGIIAVSSDRTRAERNWWKMAHDKVERQTEAHLENEDYGWMETEQETN